MEGYRPSNEEIKKAEDAMTPEQKSTSSAREEGYNIGLQEGKKIAYAVSTVNKIEEATTRELIATVGNWDDSKFRNFVTQEAENNNVKVAFIDIPSVDTFKVTIKVSLSGSPVAVKRVVQNMLSMAKSYKEELEK
jgi:hypothetical protein